MRASVKVMTTMFHTIRRRRNFIYFNNYKFLKISALWMVFFPVYSLFSKMSFFSYNCKNVFFWD